MSAYINLFENYFAMVDRDEKVIWQKHTCCMTHPAVAVEWTQYKDGCHPAIVALEASRKKALVAAQALINKEKRKKDSKAQKATEQKRIQGLSGPERELYNEPKKARTEANRVGGKRKDDLNATACLCGSASFD